MQGKLPTRDILCTGRLTHRCVVIYLSVLLLHFDFYALEGTLTLSLSETMLVSVLPVLCTGKMVLLIKMIYGPFLHHTDGPTLSPEKTEFLPSYYYLATWSIISPCQGIGSSTVAVLPNMISEVITRVPPGARGLGPMCFFPPLPPNP